MKKIGLFLTLLFIPFTSLLARDNLHCDSSSIHEFSQRALDNAHYASSTQGAKRILSDALIKIRNVCKDERGDRIRSGTYGYYKDGNSYKVDVEVAQRGLSLVWNDDLSRVDHYTCDRFFDRCVFSYSTMNGVTGGSRIKSATSDSFVFLSSEGIETYFHLRN